MPFQRPEFEKLDSALAKAFPTAGTKDFPRAFLPSVKFKTVRHLQIPGNVLIDIFFLQRDTLCDGLSAYLGTLLVDARYSESPLVIDVRVISNVQRDLIIGVVFE